MKNIVLSKDVWLLLLAMEEEVAGDMIQAIIRFLILGKDPGFTYDEAQLVFGEIKESLITLNGEPEEN